MDVLLTATRVCICKREPEAGATALPHNLYSRNDVPANVLSVDQLQPVETKLAMDVSHARPSSMTTEDDADCRERTKHIAFLDSKIYARGMKYARG